jgi:transposase-like protein
MPTQKNHYNPPTCTDERLKYVEVECGRCYECKRAKARQWKIRNAEQLKETPTAVFFTGTFTDERIEKIAKKYNIDKNNVNEIATKEVRLFLERLRKINGKSIKHWIVTEKGHTNTRRIHIHGLFYAKNGTTKWQLNKLLRDNWIAGYSYYGSYVNEKTINYVSKYLTKDDLDNKDFTGKILVSPGLGKNYVNRMKQKHLWKNEKTNVEYQFKNGQVTMLPKYYKQKLFTEDERERLWIYKMEEGYKYVMGEKIRVTNKEEEKDYNNICDFYRERNKGVHFDNLQEWNIKKFYNKVQNREKYTKKYVKIKWDLYKKDYKRKEKEIWNIEKIQELNEKTLSVKKWSEINEYENIAKKWNEIYTPKKNESDWHTYKNTDFWKRYQWDELPMRF